MTDNRPSPALGDNLNERRGDVIVASRKMVAYPLHESAEDKELRAELWKKHGILKPQRMVAYCVEIERTKNEQG